MIKRTDLIVYLFGFWLVFGLTSCDKKGVFFSEAKTFDNGYWTYDDLAAFDFEVVDTSVIYALMLHADFSREYDFQNTYLRIHTTFPDGNRESDQININLFDHRGVPNGGCSGSDCRVNILLQESVRFADPGSYQVAFEQYTRTDTLMGIHGLTLELWDAKELALKI